MIQQKNTKFFDIKGIYSVVNDLINIIVFILAVGIIILKLFMYSIVSLNRKPNKTGVRNILLKQPLLIAISLLMVLIIKIFLANIFNVEIVSQIITDHYDILFATLELLRIILIIALLFKEEILLYQFIRKKINPDNKTLFAFSNQLHHGFRLLIIFIILPLLLPVFNSYNLDWASKKLITITIIWGVAWFTIKTITITAEVISKKRNNFFADSFEARSLETKIKILTKLIMVIIILTGLALTLMSFESLKGVGASIFASAGLLTALIGFSAQKSMGTFLMGLQIAITQPIKINDIISIENEFGTVEEILFTYVVIRTWDWRRLIVPTNYFLEKSFINHTRSSTNVLCPIIFYADYTLPIDKVRNYFLDVIKDSEFWDKNVANLAVIDASRQVIQVRALASAKNRNDASNLTYTMLEKIIGFIATNHPDSLPKVRAI